MTTPPSPGEWLEPAAALRLAAELADLRIAATNATGLPLHTPTHELAAALEHLAPARTTPRENKPMPSPNSVYDMSVGDLADAIYEFAGGDRGLQAAADLLSHHSDLLRRPEFRALCTVVDDVGVEVDWQRLDRDMPPFSSGERQFLRIAASLACEQVRINLRDAVTGLDELNQRLVVDAVAYASRGGR